MKKLIYKYSNGIEKEHRTYIKSTTIRKEAKGSNIVSIYERKDDLPMTDKYITSIILQ